ARGRPDRHGNGVDQPGYLDRTRSALRRHEALGSRPRTRCRGHPRVRQQEAHPHPPDPTDVRDCRRRHMDLNIRGRKALVTGASSGIGLETARQLLDEGAIVVMTGPEPDELKAAVDELAAYKERIYAHDADIADD